MNSFQALCKLASEEQCCWNIYCTTCGHMHFRYAFSELAKGKSPEDSEWIVHKKKTSYKQELGAIPRRYSGTVKESILKICLAADLYGIAEKCSFPDWLGYLGLIINHFSSAELYSELSTCWAGQLMLVIPERTKCHFFLQEIISGERILTVRGLSLCEQALLR